MKKMKHSIKKHISIIIIFCSVIAVSFTAILVNLTITKTFDSYLENVKDKKNSRIFSANIQKRWKMGFTLW